MNKWTGSEKQISWARDIRDMALTVIDRYYDDMIGKLPDGDKKDLFVAAIDGLRNCTDARFWIDYRSATGDTGIMGVSALAHEYLKYTKQI